MLATRVLHALADAAIPTYHPNNVSIVTGAPPAAHGIAGNYNLDRETGHEIMMTDPNLMRRDTILAPMARAGVPTAAITAKDKLRRLLGRNLAGICFSSECAPPEVEAMVGRAKPDMYSADLSLFVLDAGIALLEREEAGLLDFSLSHSSSSTRTHRTSRRPMSFTARSTIGWAVLSSSAPSSGWSPTTA